MSRRDDDRIGSGSCEGLDVDAVVVYADRDCLQAVAPRRVDRVALAWLLRTDARPAGDNELLDDEIERLGEPVADDHPVGGRGGPSDAVQVARERLAQLGRAPWVEIPEPLTRGLVEHAS